MARRKKTPALPQIGTPAGAALIAFVRFAHSLPTLIARFKVMGAKHFVERINEAYRSAYRMPDGVEAVCQVIWALARIASDHRANNAPTLFRQAVEDLISHRVEWGAAGRGKGLERHHWTAAQVAIVQAKLGEESPAAALLVAWDPALPEQIPASFFFGSGDR